MSDETRTAVKPLGDRLYVQRIRETHYEGGIIHKPETFSPQKKFGARERMNAIPDFFLAKVLAVGPDERSGLKPGDHTLVWSYADGDGSKLYTGESVGEKDRLFIKGDSGAAGEKCDHLGVAVDP